MMLLRVLCGFLCCKLELTCCRAVLHQPNLPKTRVLIQRTPRTAPEEILRGFGEFLAPASI